MRKPITNNIQKVKRGEIYLVQFDEPKKPNQVGKREQAGIRPVVIVQNDVGNAVSPCTIVCPLTSRDKKDIVTHYKVTKEDGVKKDSIVMLEQIRTIDKDRIIKKLGRIENKKTIDELDKKLKLSLGLK